MRQPRNINQPPRRPHAGCGGLRGWLGSWTWLVLPLLASLVFSVRAGEPQPPTSKEYQVKAAFVYNFLKFIEWPTTNAPAANAPVVIGVVDKGPMLEALTLTAKGRRINGHDLVVKTLENPAEAKAVQVLFVPGNDRKHLSDWLGEVQTASVLTIGESETFAHQHGMINFLLEGDKVRFEIDVGAAEHAGLTISAQLQKLARAVRRGN